MNFDTSDTSQRKRFWQLSDPLFIVKNSSTKPALKAHRKVRAQNYHGMLIN